MKVDLGAQVLSKLAVAPVVASDTNTTINGLAIDRTGYESGVIVVSSGAVSGTPDSFTITATLQSSSATGSGWADVAATLLDVSGNTATNGVTLTAASTLAELAFRAVGLKKYIRVVLTAAFTGGTAPGMPVSAVIILGEARTEPC